MSFKNRATYIWQLVKNLGKEFYRDIIEIARPLVVLQVFAAIMVYNYVIGNKHNARIAGLIVILCYIWYKIDSGDIKRSMRQEYQQKP